MLSKSGNFGPHLSLCSNICRERQEVLRGTRHRILSFTVKAEERKNIIDLLMTVTPHHCSILLTISDNIERDKEGKSFISICFTLNSYPSLLLNLKLYIIHYKLIKQFILHLAGVPVVASLSICCDN